jgi:hypothetical protein
MKTLMIEDLSKNDEMDRTAMTHVSGGRLPQVMVDTIKFVDDYTHGRCDNNGVSIVCY